MPTVQPLSLPPRQSPWACESSEGGGERKAVAAEGRRCCKAHKSGSPGSWGERSLVLPAVPRKSGQSLVASFLPSFLRPLLLEPSEKLVPPVLSPNDPVFPAFSPGLRTGLGVGLAAGRGFLRVGREAGGCSRPPTQPGGPAPFRRLRHTGWEQALGSTHVPFNAVDL